jgi:hypothetical protein
VKPVDASSGEGRRSNRTILTWVQPGPRGERAARPTRGDEDVSAGKGSGVSLTSPLEQGIEVEALGPVHAFQIGAEVGEPHEGAAREVPPCPCDGPPGPLELGVLGAKRGQADEQAREPGQGEAREELVDPLGVGGVHEALHSLVAPSLAVRRCRSHRGGPAPGRDVVRR